MPRPPKSSHPIRELRAILQVGQADFAKQIGISPSGLQRIELGSLKLHKALATRIALMTGVNVSSRDWKKSIQDENRVRLHFSNWQRVVKSPAGNHFAQFLAEEFGSRLACLLEAAQTTGKLAWAESEVSVALDEIAKKLGLGKAAAHRLAEKSNGTTSWNQIGRNDQVVFFSEGGKHFLPNERLTVEDMTKLITDTPSRIGIGCTPKGLRILFFPGSEIPQE